MHRSDFAHQHTASIRSEPRITGYAVALRADRPATAIDVGLAYFATLANGSHIDNPRYLRGQAWGYRRSS